MAPFKAIYEAGVLRPLEPLPLTEGEQVELLVISNGCRHQPETNDVQPEKTIAEIMQEAVALAIQRGEIETESFDHDEILYGESNPKRAW